MALRNPGDGAPFQELCAGAVVSLALRIEYSTKKGLDNTFVSMFIGPCGVIDNPYVWENID